MVGFQNCVKYSSFSTLPNIRLCSAPLKGALFLLKCFFSREGPEKGCSSAVCSMRIQSICDGHPRNCSIYSVFLLPLRVGRPTLTDLTLIHHLQRDINPMKSQFKLYLICVPLTRKILSMLIHSTCYIIHKIRHFLFLYIG